MQDARGALQLAEERGERRGEQRGERRKALDTARKMLADGLDQLLLPNTPASPLKILETYNLHCVSLNPGYGHRFGHPVSKDEGLGKLLRNEILITIPFDDSTILRSA